LIDWEGSPTPEEERRVPRSTAEGHNIEQRRMSLVEIRLLVHGNTDSARETIGAMEFELRTSRQCQMTIGANRNRKRTRYGQCHGGHPRHRLPTTTRVDSVTVTINEE
jgi:hypothetical protein